MSRRSPTVDELLEQLRALDRRRPVTLTEIDGLQREASRIASRERLSDPLWRDRQRAGVAARARAGPG